MARNRYDQDEDLEVKFDLNQVKRLLKYVKPYRGKMILTIALMLISSALGMLIPLFLKQVMDVYIPDKNMRAIVGMSVLTLVVVLAVAIILRVKITLTSRIGQGVIHSLRRELFDHLQELPFSYYDSRPHGKIQVRLVNYVNNLSDLLSNGIVNTITDYCAALIFIIFFDAGAECAADAFVHVRHPCFGGAGDLCKKAAEKRMADFQQQAVQLKCLYRREYQWDPRHPGLCAGRAQYGDFQ